MSSTSLRVSFRISCRVRSVVLLETELDEAALAAEVRKAELLIILSMFKFGMGGVIGVSGVLEMGIIIESDGKESVWNSPASTTSMGIEDSAEAADGISITSSSGRRSRCDRCSKTNSVGGSSGVHGVDGVSLPR